MIVQCEATNSSTRISQKVPANLGFSAEFLLVMTVDTILGWWPLLYFRGRLETGQTVM
jgi:hypothetical protein